MFFENPVFLYGLFSLAIPVIIHLFNFQRPKVVYFTNLKFIKLADENTKRGIALKHLLILLMRLLFLFFLVMAFARPVFGPRSGNSTTTRSIGVYLDNSMSMQNQVSGGRALEVGLAYLTSLADASSSSTRFRFTDNGFRYQDQALVTKEKFKDRLTEESYTFTGRELKNIWNRQLLAGAESDFQVPQTIYWLSDFQKSTVGNLSEIIPYSNIQLQIIPIQNPDIANVYVDSVWLASPFIKLGEVNYLKAKLKNTGTKQVNGLSISCLVDEKASGNVSLDIPATGSSELEFGFTPNSNGEIKVKLAFEEQPVSFDNEFFAVIHPAAKINVSVISNSNQSFVQQVYEGEEAFVVKKFSTKNLDYTFLQKSNVVIVEDLESLDDNVVKFLQKFAAGGGHLVLIPSTINEPRLTAVTKSFGLSNVSYSKESTKISLAVPNKKQPFFAGIFEEITSDMTMPEVINMLKWTGMNEDILIGKTGTPYLSAQKLSKGYVYLMASPLEAKFTNLAAHSLFVPLMYKLAIRSQANQENLAYRIGQSNIQLSTEEAASNTLFSLSKPGFSLLPEQKISGNLLTLSLPKENITPGFYTLSAPGLAAMTIALNADKNESEMATYTVDELTSLFANRPNVSILPLGNQDNLTASAGASLSTGEAWKLCIILALIFLLAEIFLIRFFK